MTEAAIDAPSATTHVLYTTADVDAPRSIRDSHGEVVLDLCKVCGRGEIELDEPCTPCRPEAKSGAEKLETCYEQSVWYHIGRLRAELQLGKRISRREEMIALVDTIERLLTEKKFDDRLRDTCPDAGPPPPR